MAPVAAAQSCDGVRCEQLGWGTAFASATCQCHVALGLPRDALSTNALERPKMRNGSTILLSTGAVGSLLGLAALLADVRGVAAVLCGLVFALSALCLFTGWRFLSESPLTRYRERRRMRGTSFQ